MPFDPLRLREGSSACLRKSWSSIAHSTRGKIPGHPKPVILMPVGRMRRWAKSREIVIAESLRSGQSTVGGPKWTKTDLFRPKWTILVHVGLANAKIRFGHFDQNGRFDQFGPFWTSTPSDSTAASPESLARVIAASQIASVRWRSFLPRIARLAFTRLTFVPHGTAEWLARVDSVH